MRTKIFIILGISLLLLSILTGIVSFLGSKIPRRHEILDSAIISAPPDSVWRVLIDYENYPSWRMNVKRVEKLGNIQGKLSWREFDKYGQSLDYSAKEIVPKRKILIKLEDEKQLYRGEWEIHLAPAGQGTLVRINEQAEISNPILRFMMHRVFKLDATVKSFLHSLEVRFTRFDDDD